MQMRCYVPTTTLMTLEAYEKSIFHPDVEYVDGELKERNVGKYEHSRIQAMVARWFGNHESAWSTQCVTEQRMRVSETKIGIPDIALLPPGRQPDVVSEPPVLVVEILSPDDRYSDTMSKIRDYLHWGVNTVWIIDSDSSEGQMWTSSDNCAFSQELIVSGTQIHLKLADFFRELKQS
jgi:Uma2 family endonuclease